MDVVINYEGYSKINLRLVGKNKRVVIASKRTVSSNKELLFLLYAYPHTFSPRSVGVNTDRTWTLSSPLPPAGRYVLWFVFFTQKDKARPRFVHVLSVFTPTLRGENVWGYAYSKNRSSLLLLSVRFDAMTTRLFLPTKWRLILE